ncbi:MAG: hypothetical protein GTO45_08735 [Candidatus Aminicenantes bacterium]|nr:hypothetical protein [Candidatus Aminicenantes bacterium]NIM78917.1 hypothetical protein [Candidatus Aminicenantes bacterium]NIN18177.1 hypothetical protein [Candidatus Aminicenantes bacterium]NIN42076.1 hypothetical protein [Candidatus Aminicenantes bacterium]NIN84829.1 hypothetical protein [Candidatus Aminicenantes bacterium]
MQIDMHMYGVYTLARAAGLNDRTARTIAISSQYVDDALSDQEVVISDDFALVPTMTSHKPIDYQNAIKGDQWKVWLPFHFLPGNEPEDGTFLQRLTCRKDSQVAKKMVQDALDDKNRDFWPHLIGITAHVYADTFAHQGFIGISTNLNKVADVNLLNIHAANVVEALGQKLTEIGQKAAGVIPVGHGTAGINPDMPFLLWELKYKSPEMAAGIIRRENTTDFLDGAKALHSFFSRFGEKSPDSVDPSSKRQWEDIAPQVKQIIDLEDENKENRIHKWKDAINNGVFFNPTTLDKGIQYDNYQWTLEYLEAINASRDDAKNSHAGKFFRAAPHHRNYVLHHLLPEFGLLIN